MLSQIDCTPQHTLLGRILLGNCGLHLLEASAKIAQAFCEEDPHLSTVPGMWCVYQACFLAALDCHMINDDQQSHELRRVSQKINGILARLCNSSRQDAPVADMERYAMQL